MVLNEFEEKAKNDALAEYETYSEEKKAEWKAQIEKLINPPEPLTPKVDMNKVRVAILGELNA